jgi:preprotein translocase subunit YajC
VIKPILTFILLILFTISISAQIKTKEKKKTVTEEGDTVYTESTIISTIEDITPREDMIVVNPLKFFIFYNLSYFHKISDKVALGGGFQIPTISGLGGFGINAEARIYPSGKTLRGFYIAPNISYNNLNVTGGSTSAFGIGALIGWQWFPGDDFAIGLGIGIDYYTGSVDDVDDDFNNYSGSLPAVRFDIGYAW